MKKQVALTAAFAVRGFALRMADDPEAGNPGPEGRQKIAHGAAVGERSPTRICLAPLGGDITLPVGILMSPLPGLGRSQGCVPFPRLAPWAKGRRRCRGFGGTSCLV